MKGLLYSDYINSRSGFKIYTGLAIFYTLLSLMAYNAIDIGVFILFFFSALTLQPFSYDEMNQWKQFLASTPVGRRKLVQSRYLFALLCLLYGLALSLLMQLVNQLSGGASLLVQAPVLLLSFSFILLMVSIDLPLVYRWGPEKGRIIIIALLILPLIVFTAISTLDGMVEALSAFLLTSHLLLPVVMFLVAVVAFLLSLTLSTRIFLRKEL
ncbi:MAG: ABC-2 transporter permease [Eubacteriales bacterium]|jgi:ABC-2 type transport system permease protein